jgi:pyruvate,water dikinase
MRQPSAGAWTVNRIASNGYLAHHGEAAHAGGFSLAVAPEETPERLLISARLRLSGGTRAGGLVWGYRDATHYYAVLLDLSRAEVVLYRVIDGNRVRVEAQDDLELDANAWHTLKVVSQDDRVVVSLGGIRVFEEEGKQFRRPLGLRAGLISAGDAEAWFDDLRIEAAPERRRR